MVASDMLAEYVGFTEEEVIRLYQKYGMDFEEAKRWYDGYHLTDDLHFYSRDDVLTILVHLGYLAYDTKTQNVSVPNEEVRAAFVSAMKKSNWNYVIDAIAGWNKL